LALLSAAQFLVILDTSIVGIALPKIQDSLGFSGSGLQWVFNAYVIAFGGLLLLGGRLSDLLGARRVFVAGFAILVGASLLAGLADSEAVLLVGRALQGVGAAFVAPSAMTIVLGLFTDPKELGKAMGIWGASAPAGGTAGVFLGGVITEWISWRWTFLINVPVGVLVLLAVPGLLPAGAARRPGRVDIVGALTVTAAISLAVYAIVDASNAGWGSLRTIGLLALAAALTVVFVAVERVRREPLVRLRIFRLPNLGAANLTMALLGAAWIPLWFFLNLYLQRILGYGAFASGAALLPMTATILVLMVAVTGRVVQRFGLKPPMIVGLVTLAAATLLFARTPLDGSFGVDVLAASLLAALGMSLAFIPTLLSALAAAPPEDAGLASGLVNTSYQVGSALGLAFATAIATSATGGSSLSSLNEGYHAAFITAAALAAVGALAGIALIRKSRSTPASGEAAPERELKAA
jgi:EmrB/QacA subfamily drug resistance transporter